MKSADLHIHSIFSDGSLTCQKIIATAKEKKIACIAITDHDSVEAYTREDILKDKEIEVIPAVELTTEYNSSEIHILGYFIDYQNPTLLKKLEFLRERRILRIKEMIKKLNALGIDIDFKEVTLLNNCSSVTRLHLAQALLRKGIVNSILEAFIKYLGENAPCYVGGFHFLPSEAISLIRDVKGLSILAHPYSIENLEEILTYLIGCGLSGIEVYYPEHTDTHIRYYEELAHKYELLITGGSDFHGNGQRKTEIGSVCIPYDLVEKLKEKLC